MAGSLQQTVLLHYPSRMWQVTFTYLNIAVCVSSVLNLHNLILVWILLISDTDEHSLFCRELHSNWVLFSWLECNGFLEFESCSIIDVQYFVTVAGYEYLIVVVERKSSWFVDLDYTFETRFTRIVVRTSQRESHHIVCILRGGLEIPIAYLHSIRVREPILGVLSEDRDREVGWVVAEIGELEDHGVALERVDSLQVAGVE